MKTTHRLLVLVCGMMLFFVGSAGAVPVRFEKAWGDGQLLEGAAKSGVIEYVTSGKGEPGFVSAPLKLVDLAGKSIYFDIKIDDMRNYSGVEIWLGDEEFDNYYLLNIPYFDDPEFNILQSEFWHNYSFGLANASVVGHPEKAITHIGVYIEDNGAGPLTVSLTNIRFLAAPKTGYVSVTFDDGYLSQYEAAQVMGEYGFAGTAYIMPRQIGEPGYMSKQQLAVLKEKYHWGISSHHAVPYTEFVAQKLSEEIDYTINYLTENGYETSARHLAYPLGKQDRERVLPLVRRYFATARLADGGVETLPPADQYLLRSINVVDTTSPEDLAEQVRRAVDNGQWAILMFHYVVDEPQSPIEYNKDDFRRLMALLAEAHVPVLPVHEVYQRYNGMRAAQH